MLLCLLISQSLGNLPLLPPTLALLQPPPPPQVTDCQLTNPWPWPSRALPPLRSGSCSGWGWGWGGLDTAACKHKSLFHGLTPCTPPALPPASTANDLHPLPGPHCYIGSVRSQAQPIREFSIPPELPLKRRCLLAAEITSGCLGLQGLSTSSFALGGSSPDPYIPPPFLPSHNHRFKALSYAGPGLPLRPDLFLAPGPSGSAGESEAGDPSPTPLGLLHLLVAASAPSSPGHGRKDHLTTAPPLPPTALLGSLGFPLPQGHITSGKSSRASRAPKVPQPLSRLLQGGHRGPAGIRGQQPASNSLLPGKGLWAALGGPRAGWPRQAQLFRAVSQGLVPPRRRGCCFRPENATEAHMRTYSHSPSPCPVLPCLRRALPAGGAAAPPHSCGGGRLSPSLQGARTYG
ncbi:atrophin-1-like [Antechinus flavipes]|uniref:atrophin-1-like n=1 Tax=Antechinus flavipes TaxID=38775 RepID=UPI0022362896|nr:atrophin-1-like [Antechinus flavipes]